MARRLMGPRAAFPARDGLSPSSSQAGNTLLHVRSNGRDGREHGFVKTRELPVASTDRKIAGMGFGNHRGLIAFAVAACLASAAFGRVEAADVSPSWRVEWPRTDFSKSSIAFEEILSGGPPKDGIPSIDRPQFLPLAKFVDIAPTEPVVGVVLNGDARAYPLRVLVWHEIVNDTVGNVPVTVTYCPLCNSAIAFDRRAGACSTSGPRESFGTPTS